MSQYDIRRGASKAVWLCVLLAIAVTWTFPRTTFAQDAALAGGDGESGLVELRMRAYSLFPGSSADKAEAIELFTQATEQGDAESMAFLGSIYLSGNGVPADRAEAIRWYLKAAQAGHSGAAAKLAELAAETPLPPGTDTISPTQAGPAAEDTQQNFAADHTVPATPVDDLEAQVQRAIELSLDDERSMAESAEMRAILERGVEEQYPEAMQWLGILLLTEGDARESERGLALMHRFVELTGDEYGMAEIARAYETGAGTEPDLRTAQEWYERAVANGYDSFELERLRTKLKWPPLPRTTDAPTGRWGPFTHDGRHAVGIKSGASTFAFGCEWGRLYLGYFPGFELDERLQALDKVWMILDAAGELNATQLPTDRHLLNADPEAVNNWTAAAAAASSLEIGFSDDLKDWDGFAYYHPVQFSARGSAAAIKNLRAICSEIAALGSGD